MLNRLKEILVAKGFSQREGVDFNNVLCPVVKHGIIRMLLGMWLDSTCYWNRWMSILLFYMVIWIKPF